MSAPLYEILAADLLTGTIRDGIPFDSFNWGRTLNAAGAFQGTINVRAKQATAATLSPGNTLIHVMRKGVCVWSGIMWTALPDVGFQNQLQVNAEGFFSYFAGAGGQSSQGRVLTVDKTYTATDQLAVVQSLISWALGTSTQVPLISVGAETSGVDITVAYTGTDWNNIGTLISDLAGTTGAFDFSFETSFSTGSPVTSLKLWYPQQGSSSSTNVFELGANISKLQQQIDSTQQASSSYWKNPNSSDGLPSLTLIRTPISGYPVMDTVQQGSGTLATGSTAFGDQVASYADTVQNPVKTIPQLNGIIQTGTFEPGDWSIGDHCIVTANDGYLDFSDTYRIVADQVTVDAQGNEVVALTFDNAEVVS